MFWHWCYGPAASGIAASTRDHGAFAVPRRRGPPRLRFAQSPCRTAASRLPNIVPPRPKAGGGARGLRWDILTAPCDRMSWWGRGCSRKTPCGADGRGGTRIAQPLTCQPADVAWLGGSHWPPLGRLWGAAAEIFQASGPQIVLLADRRRRRRVALSRPRRCCVSDPSAVPVEREFQDVALLDQVDLALETDLHRIVPVAIDRQP